MKKVLASIFAVAVLAGCASHYDYYKAGVRYTQEGSDCVYYSGEKANRFNNEVRGMDNGKKIIYRNTLCANLYESDMAGQPARQDRQILTPAADVTPCNACAMKTVAKNTCGCKKVACDAAPVLKRRYIIVSQ